MSIIRTLPFLICLLLFSVPLQAIPVPSLIACKQRQIGLCGPPTKNPPPDDSRHELLMAGLVITGLSLVIYLVDQKIKKG